MKRLLLPLVLSVIVGCGLEPALDVSEARAEETATVELEMPGDPIFVGGYARIPISLPAGLQVEDLEFVISGGGGFVSISEERSQQTPSILLAAGRKVGLHTLDVYHGGSMLDSYTYEITDLWYDDQAGPPVWIGGGPTPEVHAAPWIAGSKGLENLDVYPVQGEYPLAIVFVETTDSPYSSQELQNAVAEWDTAANVLVDYMSEVSGGKLKVVPDIFDFAVSLSGAFADYFDEEGQIDSSFFRAAANTVLEAGIPLEEYKSVAFVSRSVDEDTYAWPMASLGRWVTIVVPSNSDKQVALGGISMPHNWPVVDPAKRRIEATLSHELFHNLQLRDMYDPAIRNVGSWDIMDWDGDLPHVSIAHKMMLGWSKDVVPFNYGDSGSVTLHPAADAVAPAGRKVGIQFRFADAINYYFEYRSEAAATVGDQSLPLPNAVLGTGMISYHQQTRPLIDLPLLHLLEPSPTGQQPFLTTAGQRWFNQGRQSNPPSEKSVTLDAIRVGSYADVTAEFGPISRADPAITPSSRATNWKSSDILITNARSDADPAWRDAIWVGAENTVWATIHNYGGADAQNVTVNFYVKDYTITNAPVFPIGTDMIDVPRDGTAQASVRWNVPEVPVESVHWCIIAEIEVYVDPITGLPELTGTNNVAQSNYSRAFSTTASPWTRELRTLTLHNTEEDEMIIDLVVDQNNPLYRSYVEHDWVRLQPGEERTVEIMVEYAGDEYLEEGATSRLSRNIATVRMTLSSAGWRGFLAAEDLLSPLEVQVSGWKKVWRSCSANCRPMTWEKS